MRTEETRSEKSRSAPTSVLILCTGNSCRSQMAEGILKHYGAGRLEVESAGSEPSRVNPTAIRVMNEIGIDLSTHRSKHVKEFLGRHFDYVITVCDKANEACPIFPRTSNRLHWPFPDPPHDKEITDDVLREFRSVRDLILARFKKAAQTGRFD